MSLAGAFVVVLLAVCIMVVLIIRKLGQSKQLVRITRIDAARAEARALAAEDVVDRVSGVAEQAVQQTGDALHVARQINKVSDQMDALLGFAMGDYPELAESAGRHAIPSAERPAIEDSIGGEFQ